MVTNHSYISCHSVLEVFFTYSTIPEQGKVFIENNMGYLNSALEKFGLVILQKENQLCLHEIGCPEQISKEILIEKMKQISEEIESNRLDFDKLVKQVVSESNKIILELCGDLFQNIENREVKVFPSTPFKEDWSANLDISFQAGVSGHELTIVYPEPYEFTDAMKIAAMKLTSKHANFVSTYLYRCIRAPCHEIIHIFQNLKKQEDTDPLSWSAEHDASYFSGSLCYQVIQKLDFLHPGFFDELVMVWKMELDHIKDNFKDLENLYLEWRNSFGLTQIGELPNGGSHYFKDRVAYDSMSTDKEILRKQICLCFKDREGDVRSEENKKRVLDARFDLNEFVF